MARAIDADALKKAIMAEPWKNEPNAVRLTVDYINIIIDEQPTVDAIPVVPGRWFPSMEEMEDGFGETHMIQTGVECSACGHYSCCGGNFCKNCGAKMDLEE